jgi:hypothetical protein
LESSGWCDPAYIVSELLTNNVWFDTFCLNNPTRAPASSSTTTPLDAMNDDAPFPFTKQFEMNIIKMFVHGFKWSTSNSTKDSPDTKFNHFLERIELNKEFCAIKQLLFHARGALLELGDVVDGFKRHVDTCGSGSGSGGGGTLGNKSTSPGRIKEYSQGKQRPKGRVSKSMFGQTIVYRGTHLKGMHVYLTILDDCNYARRSMGEYLSMHRIIDEIKEKERILDERLRKREKRELRLLCGMGGEEEEGEKQTEEEGGEEKR